MKNILTIVISVLLLTSCSQTKMAYLDMEEIMKEYKGTKEVEADMKIKSDKLKVQFDSLVNNWQNKVKLFQQNMNGMSNKAKAEQDQALGQEQQMLSQRQQSIQQQVQAEGQENLETLSEEINDFVTAYAKRNGLSLVLGTSGINGSVVYGEESMDITDDVLVQINKAYKSKKEE